MSTVRKAVRVYVSSTFRDMHAERELLETVVFPELRLRSGPLGIDLVKVDPCYGVTEEEAEGAGALGRRLQLVEECRPYFIGLIGERYGRVPGALPEDLLKLLKRYTWPASYEGLSVTELEILLASDNLLPVAHQTFFYVRDPRFIAEVPPSRRGDFQSENAHAAARLGALKYRLRTSGCRVMDGYPCRWGSELGKVTGLEAFVRQVGENLWAALSADHYPDVTAAVGAREGPGPVGSAPRAAPLPEGAAAEVERNPAPYVDHNVQFTVYRPKVVEPARWYPMLAFAHLEELPQDADPDEPDPVEEVKRQAKQLLGRQAEEYRETTKDSRAAVPREGEITFLPHVDGITFNPRCRTFLWVENVHREEFRLRAAPELEGQTARGALSVFLGSILLAEISLAIRVNQGAPDTARPGPTERSSARPYRKIFASYSHKDRTIVEEFERYLRTLGDTYLRDWAHLRAGEVWSEELQRMIEEADVFQLFWSTNSMGSPFVEREWRHALSLQRPNFVRPTYWEDPLPAVKERNLPPEELARLHFQRLTLNWSAGPTGESPAEIRTRGGKAMMSRDALPPDAQADRVRGGDAARTIRVDVPATRGGNWRAPADGGTSREQGGSNAGAGADSSGASGPGSGAEGGDPPQKKDEGSSEFELTPDEEGGLAPVDESSPLAAEGEQDIFETDFEVPALDEESGSEAVALNEADTDLESSDFDLALNEEEASAEGGSESQVVALEDEDEADSGAATVARPRRPAVYSLPPPTGAPKGRREGVEWLIAFLIGLLVLGGFFLFLWLWRR